MQDISFSGRNKRSLLCLVSTQFFGAFSDNALKSAFGFIISYQGFSVFGLTNEVALTIGALLFVSPFFLASGLAGQVADRFSRAKIIKITRAAEIGLALLSLFAIQVQSGSLLLLCMFFYSVQTAMFGPAKFGLLPILAQKGQLVRWNAVLQSITFTGILCGLMVGGILAGNNLLNLLCGLLIATSLASFTAAMLITDRPFAATAARSVSRGRLGLIAGTRSALTLVFSDRRLAWPVLSIAWFWTVGLILVSLFPAVAKDLLNITANAANALIATFVVGIALGAAIVSRLMKTEISGRFAAVSCVLMAICFALFSLGLMSYGHSVSGSAAPAGVAAFFSSAGGLAIAAIMLGLAAFSAVFVIPLYAFLQSEAGDDIRASVHAGGAILDSGVATLVSIGTAVAFSLGASFTGLLFVMAAISGAIAVVIQIGFPRRNQEAFEPAS